MDSPLLSAPHRKALLPRQFMGLSRLLPSPLRPWLPVLALALQTRNICESATMLKCHPSPSAQLNPMLSSALPSPVPHKMPLDHPAGVTGAWATSSWPRVKT